MLWLLSCMWEQRQSRDCLPDACSDTSKVGGWVVACVVPVSMGYIGSLSLVVVICTAVMLFELVFLLHSIKCGL